MHHEIDRFERRHLGLDEAERQLVLDTLGLADATALVEAAVPAAIRQAQRLQVPEAGTETEVLDRLRVLAERNEVATSLIGMGWNDCTTPPVILRNLLENPAWYTAYTPYQPEISQGRLELLLAFQTMVADLTGCELANASMLDEATAAAEAMLMLRRLDRSDRTRFFVDADCHPQTLAVVTTRAEPLGIEVVVGDPLDPTASAGVFGALLAHPGSSGAVRDLGPVIERFHGAEALVAVTTDLLACCLLTPPGELGADAVVGSAQRFGVPLGFGGPHAGFLATRTSSTRALPGRLVGVSVDSAGRPAYRLALQTREQHIRREKATSNICTAQVLLANIAAAYAAWHGPEGLRGIATRIHRQTVDLVVGLAAAGTHVTTPAFFDTVTVRVPGRAAEVLAAARTAGINLRPVDEDHLGVSLDETTTPAVVDAVLAAFGARRAVVPGASGDGDGAGSGGTERIPERLRRRTPFLEHPTFHRYRTEHEMLRWLRRLSDRDLALDRTMIPLGSCTMKLNATAEMIPITWPGFARIHPYAPAEQTAGYRQLIAELEATLCEITGYDAVSLQPNAGSQGEYAGLLAIRAWHRSRGEGHRDVCLIPSSAHGTNAASATLAGMQVVVVACDEQGNVDLDDLRARIERHGERLAAIMITYPSTHGVYEETVTQLCALVHDAGGQVYTDGANLNALVGVARPGRFGSDVSHLNLHKTFCIPHGGGGPGVGPVAVRSHLAPFLPNHPVVDDAGPATGVGPVSAAPWGSAGILPISLAYIWLMGPDGLRRATEGAVLAANYVARRLSGHYPVLYTGPGGWVAHECIVDLRELTRRSGVTVEDVAKRLADYGFHAPTMSFPVAGTLMIEPTESESLAELDRFCDAMIAVRAEIEEVASGAVAVADSVLRHAPHTADDLLAEAWDRAYPRRRAAFPLPGMTADKYFPPVGRIDQAHGDRHLACACPPVEAFAEPVG